MRDPNATLDQADADGQAPPPEKVPQPGTAIAEALAAIARLGDLKRPRSRVLHRRSTSAKACCSRHNTEEP
jgi:hypothetical protein